MTLGAIREVMTPLLRTIEAHRSVREARELMKALCVRHLPVLAGGALVGMVSERDLRQASVDGARVAEVMSPEVYVVDEATPVQEVARTLAASRFGSVVVTERGRLSGIFTTVDALRLLAAS